MSKVENILCIYQQTQPPYRHRVVYAIHKEAEIRKGEVHTATIIDPAKWIEMLLNSGWDKMKMIEELSY